MNSIQKWKYFSLYLIFSKFQFIISCAGVCSCLSLYSTCQHAQDSFSNINQKRKRYVIHSWHSQICDSVIASFVVVSVVQHFSELISAEHFEIFLLYKLFLPEKFLCSSGHIHILVTFCCRVKKTMTKRDLRKKEFIVIPQGSIYKGGRGMAAGGWHRKLGDHISTGSGENTLGVGGGQSHQTLPQWYFL